MVHPLPFWSETPITNSEYSPLPTGHSVSMAVVVATLGILPLPGSGYYSPLAILLDSLMVLDDQQPSIVMCGFILVDNDKYFIRPPIHGYYLPKRWRE
jgi:hypothetical protein